MGQYVKSTCSPIIVGCTLLEVDGVTPVPDGYYSDGTTWWQVSGEGGVISATGSCSGSTTTTTSTTSPYTAEITVYGEDNGSGSLIFTAMVTAGTTLDNLTFDGEIQRYTDFGCTSQTTECAFSSVVLNAGNTLVSSGTLCSLSSVQSLKLITLSVNSTNITSNPEVLTVGGNSYLITGFTDCTGL
jgi:hypothetical protein